MNQEEIKQLAEALAGVISKTNMLAESTGSLATASSVANKLNQIRAKLLASEAGAISLTASKQKELLASANALIKTYRGLDDSAEDVIDSSGDLSQATLKLSVQSKKFSEVAKKETEQLKKLNDGLSKAKKTTDLLERGIKKFNSSGKGMLAFFGVAGIGVKSLQDILLKYNQTMFSISRTHQVFGSSVEEVTGVLDTVRKTTVLTDQAFLDLVDTMQKGFVGLPQAASSIATFGKNLQSAFGPNIDEIKKRAEEVLGIANKFPALGKIIQEAGNIAQAGGDPKRLKELQGLISIMGRSLKFTSQEWDTVGKLTTKATDKQKEQVSLNEKVAKNEQKAQNAMLDAAKSMESALKKLNDWAGKALDLFGRWPAAILLSLAALEMIGPKFRGMISVGRELKDIFGGIGSKAKTVEIATPKVATGGPGIPIGGAQVADPAAATMSAGGVTEAAAAAKENIGKIKELAGSLNNLGSRSKVVTGGLGKLNAGVDALGKSTIGTGFLMAAAFNSINDAMSLLDDPKKALDDWTSHLEKTSRGIEQASNPLTWTYKQAANAFSSALHPLRSVVTLFEELSRVKQTWKEVDQKVVENKQLEQKRQGKTSQTVKVNIEAYKKGDMEAKERLKRVVETYETETRQRASGSVASGQTVDVKAYKEAKEALGEMSKATEECAKSTEAFIKATKEETGLMYLNKQIAEMEANLGIINSAVDELTGSTKTYADTLSALYVTDPDVIAGAFTGAKSGLDVLTKQFQDFRSGLFKEGGLIRKQIQDAFGVDIKGAIGVDVKDMENLSNEDWVKKIGPDIQKALTDSFTGTTIAPQELERLLGKSQFDEYAAFLSNQGKRVADGVSVSMLDELKKQTGTDYENAVKVMWHSIEKGPEGIDLKSVENFKAEIGRLSGEKAGGKASKEDEAKIQTFATLVDAYDKMNKAAGLQSIITTKTTAQQTLLTDVIKNMSKPLEIAVKQYELISQESDIAAKSAEEYGAVLEQQLQTERELMEAAQFGMGASIEMMQKQVDLAYELMNVEAKHVKEKDKAIQKMLQSKGLDEKSAKTVTDRLSKTKSLSDAQRILTDAGIEDTDTQGKINGLVSDRNKALQTQQKHQLKIYELTKEMREGYLDAMREMAVGAGEFEAIIGTQEEGTTQILDALNMFSKSGEQNIGNTMKMGGYQATSETAAGVGTQYAGRYGVGGASFLGGDEQDRRNKRIRGYQSSMDRYEEMQSGSATATEVGTGVADQGEQTVAALRDIPEQMQDPVQKGVEAAAPAIANAIQKGLGIRGSDLPNRGSPTGQTPGLVTHDAAGNRLGTFDNNSRVNPNTTLNTSLAVAQAANPGVRADPSPLARPRSAPAELPLATGSLGGIGSSGAVGPVGIAPSESAMERAKALMSEGAKRSAAAAALRKSVESITGKTKTEEKFEGNDTLSRMNEFQSKKATRQETEQEWKDRLKASNPKQYEKLVRAEELQKEGANLTKLGKSMGTPTGGSGLAGGGETFDDLARERKEQFVANAQNMRDSIGDVKPGEKETKEEAIRKKGRRMLLKSTDNEGNPLITKKDYEEKLQFVDAASRMSTSEEQRAEKERINKAAGKGVVEKQTTIATAAGATSAAQAVGMESDATTQAEYAKADKAVSAAASGLNVGGGEAGVGGGRIIVEISLESGLKGTIKDAGDLIVQIKQGQESIKSQESLAS